MRAARAKPHVGRPSVLVPESLEASTLLRRPASCPFGAGILPISPELCARGGHWPERLRALRLRQRPVPLGADHFFHCVLRRDYSLRNPQPGQAGLLQGRRLHRYVTVLGGVSQKTRTCRAYESGNALNLRAPLDRLVDDRDQFA